MGSLYASQSAQGVDKVMKDESEDETKISESKNHLVSSSLDVVHINFDSISLDCLSIESLDKPDSGV